MGLLMAPCKPLLKKDILPAMRAGKKEENQELGLCRAFQGIGPQAACGGPAPDNITALPAEMTSVRCADSPDARMDLGLLHHRYHLLSGMLQACCESAARVRGKEKH